jgi:hypothetical protein
VKIPNIAMPGYSFLAFFSATEHQKKSLAELEVLKKVVKSKLINEN